METLIQVYTPLPLDKGCLEFFPLAIPLTSNTNLDFDMRVAILLGSNSRGGMERQAYLLAKGLRERNIFVVILFNSRPTPSANGIDWGDIPTEYTWKSQLFSFITHCNIARLLKKYNIDIFHVFFWKNMEFCAPTQKFAPNTQFIGSQRDTSFGSNKIIRDRLRESCKHYRYISCNSHATKQLMDKFQVCPINKIQVINNGIADPNRSLQIGVGKFSQSRYRILFPNRFHPNKDPFLFIDACGEVLSIRDDIDILFAGSGEEEGNMRNHCDALGISHRCHFLGSLTPEEIPYAHVDIVINCSNSLEGMSNVLLESLANGTPVVATKVGGNVELLANKEFGRLVDIGDKNGLVDGINYFLNLGEKEKYDLNSTAKDFISTTFSTKTYVDSHIDYYSNCLEKRQSNVNTKELQTSIQPS